MTGNTTLHVYVGHTTFVIAEARGKQYVLGYSNYAACFFEVDSLKYRRPTEMPTDPAKRAQVPQLEVRAIGATLELPEARYFEIKSDGCTKIAICFNNEVGHYLHIFGANDGNRWMLQQHTGKKIPLIKGVEFFDGWLLYRTGDPTIDRGGYCPDTYLFEADYSTLKIRRG